MPRRSFTVKQKLELLRQVEKNKNLDKTARDNNINRRLLQRWRNDKDKLLAEATKSTGVHKRRVIDKKPESHGRYKELEKQLALFIRDRREKRLVLSRGGGPAKNRMAGCQIKGEWLSYLLALDWKHWWMVVTQRKYIIWSYS